MKKLFSLFVMAAMAVSTAWAGTATFDFATDGATLFGFSGASDASSTAGDITADATATVGGVTIVVTPSTTNTVNRLYNDYNLGMQLRIYSGKMTITAPEGNVVKKVTFTTAKWTEPTPSAGAFTEMVWEGSDSPLTLSFGAQCRISKMEVEYAEGSGSGTVDPTMKEIDSFKNFADMDNDTEFKFTSTCYVTQVFGKYTYVRSGDYAGLLYNLATTFKIGDEIAAGWVGTKTSYKNQSEVTSVTGIEGTGKQVAVEATDMNALLNDVAEVSQATMKDIENDYVMLSEATLSEADAKGNFTMLVKNAAGKEFVINGFNKFGITYPETVEGKQFAVKGVFVFYNDAVQIMPMEIEEIPASGINDVTVAGNMDGVRYNVLGQKVDENYRGVVIVNGKKMIQK